MLTNLSVLLLSLTSNGPAFPPGRRFSASEFWGASVILPLANGPERSAADLIATGESAMLGWAPPTSSTRRVNPLSESHTLVRLLGGGTSALGTPGKHPPNGDVVLRNEASHQLETQWELLWSRLDPWVNSSLPTPILVLDNVPYAFCDPMKCNANGSLTPGSRYGMDFGPNNVTEYANWIETLLVSMIARYGEARCSNFWFRVATEPNTRPGHWNDTSAKYVEEYVAVAAVVEKILPRAKVGLANMAADGTHWDDEVTPMAHGVANAVPTARVDFLAMTCYGRGKHGSAPTLAQTRYDLTTAALCATRLSNMRALGGATWADLPTQVMEYGLQQNLLNRVDDDPGVFGAAWTLATSTLHARHGSERAFHWHYGETSFSHDDDACSKEVSVSKCSLYKGAAWVQAQASHLFGKSNDVVVLEATSVGSNATVVVAPASSAPSVDAVEDADRMEEKRAKAVSITSVDGLGSWVVPTTVGGSTVDGSTQQLLELRLLITAFNPLHKTKDGEMVVVETHFQRPAAWSLLLSSTKPMAFEISIATLNRTTSPFDRALVDARSHGWLTDAADPNVYPLSKAEPPLMTQEGRTLFEQKFGAEYLAMQRRTFGRSSWRVCGSGGGGGGGDGGDGGDEVVSVTCTANGSCTMSMQMAVPSVVALWVRPTAATT